MLKNLGALFEDTKCSQSSTKIKKLKSLFYILDTILWQKKPTHAIVPSRKFFPYKFYCCPHGYMAAGLFSCHMYAHDQRHTEERMRKNSICYISSKNPSFRCGSRHLFVQTGLQICVNHIFSVWRIVHVKRAGPEGAWFFFIEYANRKKDFHAKHPRDRINFCNKQLKKVNSVKIWRSKF